MGRRGVRQNRPEESAREVSGGVSTAGARWSGELDWRGVNWRSPLPLRAGVDFAPRSSVGEQESNRRASSPNCAPDIVCMAIGEQHIPAPAVNDGQSKPFPSGVNSRSSLALNTYYNGACPEPDHT